MIRVWFSNFIKRNKGRFRDLGSKLIMVAIVILIATIMLSLTKETGDVNNEIVKETYRPTESVSKGDDISKEQYEKDTILVNKFLELCNTKKEEQAYSLISDECKIKQYPTIDKFKEEYLNVIFGKKREYNLQAWISTSDYTVYKIRYTNDMLSTGEYNKENVYEDYITLLKKSEVEKISIGSFIDTEEINIETKTNEIQGKVLKRHIYLKYEEYEIYVKNNTENTIMLDRLESNQDLKLIGNSAGAYIPYINRIFKSRVIIDSNSDSYLTIRFNKPCGSSNESKYIEFSKAVRNYENYNNQSDNYNDFFEIRLKVK